MWVWFSSATVCEPVCNAGVCMASNSMVALCGGGLATRHDTCMLGNTSLPLLSCNLTSGELTVPCAPNPCPETLPPVWQLDDYGQCRAPAAALAEEGNATGGGNATCTLGVPSYVLGVRDRNATCVQVQWGGGGVGVGVCGAV